MRQDAHCSWQSYKNWEISYLTRLKSFLWACKLKISYVKLFLPLNLALNTFNTSFINNSYFGTIRGFSTCFKLITVSFNVRVHPFSLSGLSFFTTSSNDLYFISSSSWIERLSSAMKMSLSSLCKFLCYMRLYW